MESLDQIWSDWGFAIRIALIVVGLFVIRLVLLVLIRRVVTSVTSGVKRRAGADDTRALDASPLARARVVQRARTIGLVLSNLITAGLLISAVIAILSELGVAIGALAAGAGILGAALGFGAQSLVKDFISGLFIVVEDQFGVGDFVDLGSATGVVESIGLRVTQVRDLEGTVWYVRNGEILRVGNSSQGWSRVILDLPLAYNSDLDKTKKVIEQAASKLAETLGSKSGLIGKAQVWGIQALEGGEVVFRVVQQVRPSKKDELARLIRLEVKKAIDKAGIKLSKPQDSRTKG
ncbi:MAG: mechanosensitive ion channel family protein [Rhodoluna sp.]|nr:mechanosensitive ion channel family protein [Rhodoluna sp.]